MGFKNPFLFNTYSKDHFRLSETSSAQVLPRMSSIFTSSLPRSKNKRDSGVTLGQQDSFFFVEKFTKTC